MRERAAGGFGAGIDILALPVVGDGFAIREIPAAAGTLLLGLRADCCCDAVSAA